jgi:hypothetical protein
MPSTGWSGYWAYCLAFFFISYFEIKKILSIPKSKGLTRQDPDLIPNTLGIPSSGFRDLLGSIPEASRDLAGIKRNHEQCKSFSVLGFSVWGFPCAMGKCNSV